MLPILLSVFCLQQSDVEKGASSFLGKSILSDNWQQRRMVYRYAMNTVIGFKRERYKPFLIHVIRTDPLMPPKDAPINGEEATHSPKRIALSILAEWHDPTLVPFFLEYLDAGSPDPNNSGMAHNGRFANEDFAAVKGLINIGKPAVEPCLRELARLDKPDEYMRAKNPQKYNATIVRYGNLIYVLGGILGYDETQKLFKKEIERVEKSDQASAKRMRDVLDYFETYFRTFRDNP